MPFKETKIPGLIIFEPKIWRDERGYFYEAFNQNTFKEAGITAEFVQDNQALSTYGVLRGLHYQLPPYSQAKLVRVIQGAVLDVVVDIREGSPTYGEHYSIYLSGENKTQLFVPRGMAHGYAVLSDTAIFSYKCDNFYSKKHDAGVLFNDSAFNIDWQLKPEDMILSEKDQLQPRFGNHKKVKLEEVAV
jgi:dTDP-4-dehydrorhamnose 3,5-epimerase